MNLLRSMYSRWKPMRRRYAACRKPLRDDEQTAFCSDACAEEHATKTAR